MIAREGLSKPVAGWVGNLPILFVTKLNNLSCVAVRTELSDSRSASNAGLILIYKLPCLLSKGPLQFGSP